MKNIKTFEGFLDFFKGKKVEPNTTHYWHKDEINELEDIGFEYIDTQKSNDFGYFKFEGMYLVKTAIGINGREDYRYDLIHNGKVIKDFSNIIDIKNWINNYFSLKGNSEPTHKPFGDPTHKPFSGRPTHKPFKFK